MSDEIDRAQLLEIRERESAIAAVSAALPARDFRWGGDCVECLDPIEEERAKANPAANRCLICQEALEKRRRLFPGS